MARRGRKARMISGMTKTEAAQVARSLGSFFRAGNKAPRARRQVSRMSNAEMSLRQAEAAALLGASRPGFISRTYSRASGAFRGKTRRKSMPRGRKNGVQGQSYAQVTGNLPVQVSITVAEGLFALGSVGIDVYTSGTASKADDLAFPVVEFIGATAARWASQRFLSKKHPGLAATVAHGFSAMNGDRVGTAIRVRLASFLKPSGPPSSGPSGP